MSVTVGKPTKADFRAALSELSTREKLIVMKEMISFVQIYGKFNWGRQIMGQALTRLFRGEYSTSRWA